ncbi:thiamine pyrophosphate-binding protein [Salsipaludibacter albus]|uniref:thiamine pyrophosphate-binding protein n=1 Tax=Salsipaludibacter albus TaxID=2849650 RepID=UPI001EE44541|nr:thiamine pyrophosphate-binding protein [Salsipaludibacter albus]MBY5162410.1 thiamine pyrophosphate-binding protein [Salsipaludibacter albus]
MAEKVTGGTLMARLLAAEGVDTIFGIIDGSYFGLYNSLEDEGITLYSPRHESAALHMAGTWARSTNRLGVAMASNGPGVANALPGVAVENGEGNRILLVTSSRRVGITHPDRGGTYQYFDQTGVTRPMTKWSARVEAVGRVPELLRRALRVSWQGRPGVVHLDVPESILNGPAEIDEAQVWPADRYRRTSRLVPAQTDVRRAARMLVDARLPLVHAGSGVLHSGAEESLARLATLLDAPVTTSWGARGALPESDPHAIPMTHPTVVDDVRNDADVALVVGSRLGETDWWGRPPNWAPPADQRLVQVDVDEHSLGLNRPADVAMLADAREALDAIADAVEALGRRDTTARRHMITDFQSAIRRERDKLAKPLEREDASPVHPARVPAAAQDAMPEDTVWVFDGGNTAVWANFYHRALVPRSLHATFKFGMLGAGMGQSLGAAVAHPGRRVCCIIGDGAFGMHPTEVETAVRHGLPIVFVVMADGAWGMVKMSQQVARSPVRSVARKLLRNESLPEEEFVGTDFSPVRYDRLAEAMGADGFFVDHSRDLLPALREAAALDGPSVVHVQVDRVEHLWAPELRTFKRMHEEPGG